MSSSIISALGGGSGIDVAGLVAQLSAATREPAEALIARREAANGARISALAQIGGAIDGFSSALSSLIAGGGLSSRPVLSDESIAVASVPAGTALPDISTQIEVIGLARAQVLNSAPLADAGVPAGEGELTFSLANGSSFSVTVDAANNSLAGLAATINAAQGGIMASVVTDDSGARLVLRGQTGEASAFTVGASGGALAQFASPAMVTAQTAADARIRVDGVEARSASNRFTGLLAGITLEVKKPSVGQVVLSVARPTEAIRAAVEDFVGAFNELRAVIAEATANRVGEAAGPARGDTAIAELSRRLSQLPTMQLASGGGPHTLAEIGVRTNRDGTLGIDSARLTAMLASDPEGVEKLFAGSQSSGSPLVSIRSAVGSVPAGSYAITGIVPAAGGAPASGFIDGIAMLASGSNLVAPASSPAAGLILAISGNPASATIRIDAGLGGALKAIRDSLLARDGVFSRANERFDSEARRIADDRAALERRSEKHSAQLLATFTAMDRRVSALKSTQSYLEQQIAIWNSKDG